jgi:glycosyltransferase involved in cell wall biosynthesis
MTGRQSESDVSESEDAGTARAADPTVTVVVPVHNEAGYIETALPQLERDLAVIEADIRILVVENGSTDGTAEIVADLMGPSSNIQMLQLPEPNYGAAIRAGFAAASSDWVVVFDIDYFSGSFLASALEERHRSDIVIGSKRAPGSDDQRSSMRRFATWLLNSLLRVVLGLNVSDTHGMKAIRGTVVDAVLQDVVSTKDLFDTELVLRAERAGFRIVELPVVVAEERESRSRIWVRVPRTLKGIWAIRRAL